MNLAIGYPQFAPNTTTHGDMANQPGAVTDVTSMHVRFTPKSGH
jgi:hypothetical protein